MLKRYLLASLVAGLALAAQSAVASDLWFYEGHGWLAQPPILSERNNQSALVVAGPASEITVSNQRRAVNRQANASSRTGFPAPYDIPGQGYFN